MDYSRATIGDRVRIRRASSTSALGLSGKLGTVYGYTSPSVTGVEVVGGAPDDYAVAVVLEEGNEQFWFAPDLLELVNFGQGSTMKIAERRFVRDDRGEWRESKTN